MPLKSCFALCGSTDFTKRSIGGADSSFQCSLYYNSGEFSSELAGVVLQKLRDAYSHFSSVTNSDNTYHGVRVVVVGTDDGRADGVSNNGLIIVRNSSSYSSFDSAAPASSNANIWVHALACFFSLAATDSTFLFDAGWSEYLTTNFFLFEARKEGEAQQRVRLDLLSRTLDFYPAQTLAQAHRSRKNEQAVFFNKGAYVFLMLEYVIGEAAFDSVTRKLYHDFRNTPITLSEFQQLCEEAYRFTPWLVFQRVDLSNRFPRTDSWNGSRTNEQRELFNES